jgi:hypothetical protein
MYVLVPFYFFFLIGLPVAGVALTAIISRVALAQYAARPRRTVAAYTVVFLLGLFCAWGTWYSAVQGF